MLLVEVLCVVVKLLVMNAGSTAAFVCMLGQLFKSCFKS